MSWPDGLMRMPRTVFLSGPAGTGKTTILRMSYDEKLAVWGRTAAIDTDQLFVMVDPHWDLPYDDARTALVLRQCVSLADSFFEADYERPHRRQLDPRHPRPEPGDPRPPATRPGVPSLLGSHRRSSTAADVRRPRQITGPPRERPTQSGSQASSMVRTGRQLEPQPAGNSPGDRSHRRGGRGRAPRTDTGPRGG